MLGFLAALGSKMGAAGKFIGKKGFGLGGGNGMPFEAGGAPSATPGVTGVVPGGADTGMLDSALGVTKQPRTPFFRQIDKVMDMESSPVAVPEAPSNTFNYQPSAGPVPEMPVGGVDPNPKRRRFGLGGIQPRY